jgi:hypothetical protein
VKGDVDLCVVLCVFIKVQVLEFHFKDLHAQFAVTVDNVLVVTCQHITNCIKRFFL